MICPTCGSGCNEFCGSMVQQRCSNCGTWWSPNTGEVLFVPERSKPVEVLELPDEDGDWWWWDASSVRWRVKHCHIGAHWGLGQYVRCIPPLVKPPVRDADAQILRHHANNLDRWMEADPECLKRNLRRIADRLEHETKGAECE